MMEVVELKGKTVILAGSDPIGGGGGTGHAPEFEDDTILDDFII